MRRLLRLLFDGKKAVNVEETVRAMPVQPQRKIVTDHLKQIDKSLRKIDLEAKKMKRSIDTALAIAISTGGLK